MGITIAQSQPSKDLFSGGWCFCNMTVDGCAKQEKLFSGV